MPQKAGFARPVTHSLAQREGRSDAELVFFAGAGVLLSAVAVGLRVVDVVAAWPELRGNRRRS
jgi:hypothetical protein